MTVDITVESARPQAEIKELPFHNWVLPDGRVWTIFFRNKQGYLLRFPGLADFQILADGKGVICWPAESVPEVSVQHLYLNQVLPLAMSKQGKMVFHASAVEIEDEGIAFMGESGRGKSTLAASFATNDFRFLTDDGLVVQRNGRAFDLLPSNPSIRLWEDSEQALIARGTEKAPSVEFTTKSRFLAGNTINFCDEPRRLRRVYFLGSGERECVNFDALSGRDAVIELVKHAFLLDVEDKELLKRQFEELSLLVRASSFYRLDYPRRFNDLGELRELILLHLRSE